MKATIEKQIADLLNTENQLAILYTEGKISKTIDNYLYEETDDIIKAFVECKKVQWYQFEVCHLTVSPDFRRQGLGEKIINKALNHAKNNGGRVVQCTIREDNTKSKSLFTKCGFIKTAIFFNHQSGNHVGVWQKVVSDSE